MWLLFLGFFLSLAYGLSSMALLYALSGKTDAQTFIQMYIGGFNTFTSLGLIWSAALIVGFSQHIIPDVIEAAFTESELATTEYFPNRQKYYSTRRTINFAAESIIMSYGILYLCHFPLGGLAETLMLTAGCLQWALASFVGRKLRYAAMMVHSLLRVRVKRNLFKDRALNTINIAVNVASTLTIIFVYLHIRSHYDGPFLYDRFIGPSAQVLLLLPAVLATPVLLFFNFFPREVLRKIYDKSIDVEIQSLQVRMKGENLSPFEQELRLLELNKMYREELRYSLQLTLTDLPIGVTILIMLAEPIISH